MTEEFKNDPPGGSEPHVAAAVSRDRPDLTRRGVVFNWLIVMIGGAVIALAATVIPEMIGSVR